MKDFLITTIVVIVGFVLIFLLNFLWVAFVYLLGCMIFGFNFSWGIVAIITFFKILLFNR